MQKLEEDISADLKDWGTKFQLTVNIISPDDPVKNLVRHEIFDETLQQALESGAFGQGFQRHLIFTLVKLASRYYSEPTSQDEFSPQLTWLLFEEPEAFLRPEQIDVLHKSLRALGQDDYGQVLITTHNPQFVSLAVEDLPSLIRLRKSGPWSSPYQLSATSLESVFIQNQAGLDGWVANGIGLSAEDKELEMESIKYVLWLGPQRCSAFFADRVLLVEGPTETSLIGYLMDHGSVTTRICVLDCLGKWNLHRFMNFFGYLGIDHAVLYDNDGGKYAAVDQTISKSKNTYTRAMETLPADIETYLGIPKATSPHRKPQHCMWQLMHGKIPAERLKAFCECIMRLAGDVEGGITKRKI